MCNLHDISWGNRPSSTGQEAFTSNKNDAAKAEGDYKVYRTNFVLFWLAANAGYYILIIELVDSASGSTIHDSDSGYLAYFSIYLAALVVFRVFFASIFICKWKIRYNCSSSYRVRSVNLLQEFKDVKKNCKDGESTDDDIINEELAKFYEQNRGEIVQRGSEASRLLTASGHDETRKIHDATIDYLAKKDAKEGDSDEDYDFKEFEDADVEEAEDRIYSEYKRRQGEGQPIEPALLQELAGHVQLSALDESIVLSALNGRFEQPKMKRIDTSQMLDISAMIMMPDRNRKSHVHEVTDPSAQSVSPKHGAFQAMFANLRDDKQTDPGLGSSTKSHEVLENAKLILRKNSG